MISEKTKELLAGGHTRQNRGVLMTLYDEEFHQKITSVSKNPLLICIEKPLQTAWLIIEIRCLC